MKLRIQESCSSEADPIDSKRMWPWLYVVLMMFLILLSLPVTPSLWSEAIERVGPGFNAVGYIFVLAFACWITVHMICRSGEFRMFRFFLFLVLLAIYGYLQKYHCKFPAERLHLIEYGLLACLSYRALRLDFSRAPAYVLAFLISAAFGYLDEMIQYVLPNRVFESRDVMTNVIASALGLLVMSVWLGANSRKGRVERDA